MRGILRKEQGVTLIELIVVMILLGVALPSLFSMIGYLASHHAKNEIYTQCMVLANDRLEEIYAFKKENSDWYKNIMSFNQQENLDGGFIRETSITKVNNWGNANLEAYDVTVKVTHSQIPDGYRIKIRLTKFSY
jgi:prepilin-type N-terminal cleavage/methylation domain-containing protein